MVKMEQAMQLASTTSYASNNNNGDLIYTWGWSDLTNGFDPKTLNATVTRTTTTYAAMFPFKTLQRILEHKTTILETNPTLDLISAAAKYYERMAESIKVVTDPGEFWNSNIDQLESSTIVVGGVHQSDDWYPIVEKLQVKATTLTCQPNREKSKRIAVMTSSFIYKDMCMAEASLPVAKNKRDYAKRHGYDFVARGAEFAQEYYRNRRPVWGKIGGIQKVLPHYNWLLWMDMDAVVVDLNKDLNEIIQKAATQRAALGGDLAKEEISLIVAKPSKDRMLNAGVMLIKNTDWSRRFFSEVQKRRYYYNFSPSYEQAAIWETMREPKWASGVSGS